MNKLDIVITQYNEWFRDVKPMLDSIELQQGINFADIKVIIVNIGGKQKFDIKAIREHYHYEIEYHYYKGEGNISKTRQKGFELGKAPYVMFCDCDDMFYNLFGIHAILYNAEQKNDNGSVGFDVLYSNFYEQHEDLRVYDREQDSVCIHGKVFRREFINNENIKWNEKLIYHEDSYYVRLALQCAKVTKYIPRGFYLWKHHEGSITRTSDEWLARTYPMLIDSSEALVKELLKRNKEIVSWYAMLMIQEGYRFFNSIYMANDYCKPYLKADIERYKAYYEKYKDIADKLSQSEQERMNKGLDEKVTLANEITFAQWIKDIYN